MDSGIRGSSSPPFSGHRSGITTLSPRKQALMESLANNHPFLDGNKRIAFAAAHTFLLVNGYDLEVRPLAAYEFMMHSIARGAFRFGPILKWINNHIRQE